MGIEDLLPSLLLALIGAGGVAVGAWITSRATVSTEKRREQRELESERRREEREREQGELVRAREMKEAARLVDEELRDATEVLRDAIYQARWWPARRQLSSGVYARYRHVLAFHLDDAAWSDVSLAYQELNKANSESEPGEALSSPLERIDLQSLGIPSSGRGRR